MPISPEQALNLHNVDSDVEEIQANIDEFLANNYYGEPLTYTGKYMNKLDSTPRGRMIWKQIESNYIRVGWNITRDYGHQRDPMNAIQFKKNNLQSIFDR